MERRKFTEEFKKNIVELYNNGKPTGEILREYDLASSMFYGWIKRYSKIKVSETETITAKEVQDLRILEEENIILKKAMVIFTKDSKNE